MMKNFKASKVSECFASQQNTKAVATLFLNILLKFNKRPFLGNFDVWLLSSKMITYIKN